MWNKTSVILMMFSRWDVWNSIKELSVINLVLADQMFISLPIIYISVLGHSFLGKQRISILLSPEATQGFSPLFFLTVILMYLLMCCCWLSQHSHRGVDVILFFCFPVFCLLNAGKKLYIPTMMSLPVQYPTDSSTPIHCVIPEEGVSVEWHCTHTLACCERGYVSLVLGANGSRRWCQSRCDNESVVTHMLSILFQHFHGVIFVLFAHMSRTPINTSLQSSWRTDRLVQGMPTYQSLVWVCFHTCTEESGWITWRDKKVCGKGGCVCEWR